MSKPPRVEQNDQTYFITKYALTTGVMKVMGHLCEPPIRGGVSNMVSTVTSGDWSGRRTLFHKPHWHTTLEDAEARVAVMVQAKFKALRKQEAALEVIRLNGAKIDDRTALAAAPEPEE